MPQGKVETVPDDGLTTRQRRRRPLVVVHTGPKSHDGGAQAGRASSR